MVMAVVCAEMVLVAVCVEMVMAVVCMEMVVVGLASVEMVVEGLASVEVVAEGLSSVEVVAEELASVEVVVAVVCVEICVEMVVEGLASVEMVAAEGLACGESVVMVVTYAEAFSNFLIFFFSSFLHHPKYIGYYPSLHQLPRRREDVPRYYHVCLRLGRTHTLPAPTRQEHFLYQ
jgi:hypothetical protein